MNIDELIEQLSKHIQALDSILEEEPLEKEARAYFIGKKKGLQRALTYINKRRPF